MPTRISRRRLLAATGVTLAAAPPVALAACGAEATDEREPVAPEREAELLNQVLAEQLGVIAAAQGSLGSAPLETAAVVNALRVQREQSVGELESAIADLGGEATSEPAERAAEAESAVEGLARQLESSIAGTLAAIGELSAKRRLPVHRAATEDAAALAVLRDTLGEEPAPDAFVMGPPSNREGGPE